MIEFKNISKHYQLKGQTLRALDQINLQIPTGSIFGIIGYSGAGKSTLIRLINLLERPNAGQVIIHQKDFTALNARELRQERAHIGMIFQHFNLLQTKTVTANIEMPLKLLGFSKAERGRRHYPRADKKAWGAGHCHRQRHGWPGNRAFCRGGAASAGGREY